MTMPKFPRRNDHINSGGSSSPQNDHHATTCAFEPFVSACTVSEFLDSPQKEILRMARAGLLTSYPISGQVRHVRKFRLSEVIRDIEKLRTQGAIKNHKKSDSSQNR